jgi:glycerol-3-phosphate acyltransferase PlsY
MTFLPVLIILAYLIGSIPSSVWLGKALFGKDVRKEGSKSSGATNAMRILGWKFGLIVLILDVLKGILAVNLIYVLPFIEITDIEPLHIQCVLGIMAIVGHIFPIYVGFKGGKGIATIVGILIGIFPLSLAIVFPVFVIIVYFSKFVSLGSILSALSLPFVFYFIFNKNDLILIGFTISLSIIVILTHRKNIKRIIAGEENVFSFKKKRAE